MKTTLACASLLVVCSLLLVPASAATVTRPGVETSSDTVPCQTGADLLGYLPAPLAAKLRAQLGACPELALLQRSPSVTLESFGSGPVNNSTVKAIWTTVLYYRIFRLYLALTWYTLNRDPFAGMRAATWAIRIYNWIQIGIYLGIVEATPNLQTPSVTFEQDLENRTLTVTAINFTRDVLWSDIEEVGGGTCDPLPSGVMAVGDKLTNCTGSIMLRYKPTNKILVVADFS